MKEKIVSTIEELFTIVREYDGKQFYFRGENKDNKKTSCLPSYLRNNGCRLSINTGDPNNVWFQQSLEYLGVGFPFTLPRSNNTTHNIIITLLNTKEHRFYTWGEDKLEALMQHYTPDLKAINDKLGKTGLRSIYDLDFISKYVDITSDIFIALHFVCSKHQFLPIGDRENYSETAKTVENGCLYIFDLQEIKKAKSVRLIYYPSYSYFCKKDGKIYYQPFDRITHQRGAFLAPQKNKNGEIDYINFQKKLQGICLCKKFIIAKNLKSELYDIFGKNKGLEYYFPKIPCTFLDGNSEIRKSYENLKSTTIFV
jgi:hypothetical protein